LTSLCYQDRLVAVAGAAAQAQLASADARKERHDGHERQAPAARQPDPIARRHLRPAAGRLDTRAAGQQRARLPGVAYSKELPSSGAPTGTDETGSPPVFTDRGYVHIIATRRGMGRSQGESVIFFNDQDAEDHARIIEWAAAQPWCDGNVVTFGTSYYGMTQPLVATKQPPALRGFFTIEMCTDYFRQLVMYGGSPQLYFLSLWMGANFTDGQAKLHVPPIARALGSQVFNTPLKKLWWPQVQKRLAKIQVPFVVAQNPGHFNLHQFGAYDLFQNAATPRDRRWLIIGPAEYDLPCMHWQLEALAFFDHLLHGADNGYAQQPAVRYYTDGTGDYRTATDFPIPGSETVRLYPAAGAAGDATHALTADAAEATGTSSWAAVPKGAPVTAGFDEVTNQTISYEMQAGEDTEFCGPVTANLRFSCNEIDSHVVARLGRVDATGTYHLLAREREKAAYGFGDLVDEIVYSHEAGMNKPDPRIYTLLCSRLDVRPEETVFVDDTDQCVIGARNAGIQAVYYRDNAQVIGEIEKLLTIP
jgi:uncharacterized protein